MRFFNNLFGTIAQSAGIGFGGYDFIPKNNEGDILNLKGQDAVWLGLKSRDMQKYAYEYCAALSSVVDRLAEADKNGKPYLYKIDSEDISKSDYSKRIKRLFKKPNAMQTWKQFREQQTVYKKIFGYCPVFPIVSKGLDGSFAKSMWNLPPWLVEIVGTGKMLYQTDLSEIVKEYRINILGDIKSIPGGDIILLQDGNFQDEQNGFITPISKLVGLDYAISNYCAAVEADNVLLRKKGPLGFISHDAAAAKDNVAGYIPMTHTEKNEVQSDLQRYGLSLQQWQYVISRQALKWQPMGFDVKKLGTKETIIQNTQAICQRFGYSYTLYCDSDSTYANQGEAHKALYQNNVIPNNEADMEEYERFFKCEENNVEIKCKFNHLPVLQQDELKKQEAALKQTQALQLDYQNGLITLNQYREARGWPIVTGGDTYYEKPKNVDNGNEEVDTAKNAKSNSFGHRPGEFQAYEII